MYKAYQEGKMPQQQSHHCGIESSKVIPQRASLFSQQSHHCGIEREWSEERIQAEIGSSNRTIVGLKVCFISDPSLQRSAAIAPLWD